MALQDFMPSETPVTLGRDDATKCLILLHGLTMTGRRFVPVGQFLLSRLGINWQIILPTAPTRQVTWLGGKTANAWFDLPVGSFNQNQDETGIWQAQSYVHRLIDQLVSDGIHSQNIVIGGFSQGGALALLSALTYADTLGGAVCLSGYLPLADQADTWLAKAKPLPIRFAHGTNDVPIPLELAEHSAKRLQDKGFAADVQVYPIGHTLDERELADTADWLQAL